MYTGENKLYFDEMMTSAMYQSIRLHWIFIVLAHGNNSVWVDMSLHSTHYRYFEQISLCSHSLMLCVQQRSSKYQFHSHLFDRPGLEPTIYRTQGAHTKLLHLRCGFLSLWDSLISFNKCHLIIIDQHINMLNKIQKYVYVYLLTSIRPLWWKLSVTGISKDFCMNITDIV